MMYIRPCPICGKMPKIKRDYNYEDSFFGAWCTIQCKPFLRRAHVKVEHGNANWDIALERAIDDWNRMVERCLYECC